MKKQNKRRWTTAVFGGVFLAGVVLVVPYLIFWAVSALQLARIDYNPITIAAYWVIMALLGFSMPPRKLYIARV